MIRLTDQELKEFASYFKLKYGIDLSKKKQLIETRMHMTLAEKNVRNFSEYFDVVKQANSKEAVMMLDKLTTNHTFFLREPKHYEFLKENILPEEEKNNRENVLRIWSAGCSTGEEAYTAAMVLKDYFGFKKWDYRILATDISEKTISEAQTAVYHKDAIKSLPPPWIRKYFVRLNEPYFALSDEIKKEVIFHRFNLMDPFLFNKPFHLIFCRNVMIYFDQATKNELIRKFYNALKPGGYLFIGHSETIQRDISRFKYVKPSIYLKG